MVVQMYQIYIDDILKMDGVDMDITFLLRRMDKSTGAHTKGYNNIFLGICMQGDYKVEKVSEIKFKALIELYKYL